MTTLTTATTTATATATDRFDVQPYTPHCQVIHAAGDHALIGISPGNSYFSAQRVLDLGHWGSENFREVDILYTDLYVAEMYEAFGYDPIDAQRKAVKNLRGVRAKVNNAAAALDPGGGRIRARALSEFTDNEEYRRIHARILRLLDSDDEFRRVCEGLAAYFLSTKSDGPGTQRQRTVCLNYICAEAPLFLDTPAIFGVPSSLNCYHQLLPMAELLYSRGAGLRASRNQGHAIITPAEGAPDVR
ncbi:tRNA-dependent cyclodipeptide synthase [Streptomyces sp. NPDC033753]|uniref:tRNA-dependent cyclodipeptide synthase n=1 Tax=Streptomyces sp. NPDC033753 TaxID=3155128 RepID=UPI0033DF38A0